MSNPCVWIIVPSFDEAEAVCSTVQPLLEANYNVVVVDDESSDNTVRVLTGTRAATS